MFDSTAPEAIRAAAIAGDQLLRADRLGVPTESMARAAENGVLERVAPGVYVGATWAQHPLIEAAAWSLRHPTAVACLLTAAQHHDLTDAFAQGLWLMVPKGTTVPRSLTSALHIVQVTADLIDPDRDVENEIIRCDVHGVRLRLTGPDRTVIDHWKYPRRVTHENALVALRRRSHAPDFEVPRFARLARRLGAWDHIEQSLQAMMVRA